MDQSSLEKNEIIVPEVQANGDGPIQPLTKISLGEACRLLSALCPNLELGRNFTASMLPQNLDGKECEDHLNAQHVAPHGANLYERRAVNLRETIAQQLAHVTNNTVGLSTQ